MLTPEYLASVGNQIESLYETLDQQITADICRRVVKTGTITPTAAYQAKKVQEAGKLYEDIIADVAKATKKNDAEIAQMFKDAGVKAVQYDATMLINAGINVPNGLSPKMLQVLEANMRSAQKDLKNLSGTTAGVSQQKFIEVMNQSVMMVESGAFDYQTAIRRAVNELSQYGSKVLYESGNTLAIESAARLNILTGVNQTCSEITKMNCERLDTDYVETTAHMGARPTHEVWQGKVFKLHGADDYENFYDVCGEGEPDGICGCNCRHSYYPFFPGVSKSAYPDLDRYTEKTVEYNGNEYSDYEASQIQRRYERAIRDSKRTIAGYDAAIDDCTDEELKRALEDGRNQAKQTLRDRRNRLTDFCNQTGREKESIRHKTSEPSKVSVSFAKPMKISFPDEVTSVKGITEEVKQELDQAMKKLEGEYDIRLSQIVVEKAGKGDIFVTGYVQGESRMAMLVNKDKDFDKVIAEMGAKYESGYFAGKSLEDYMAHEAFHVMLYQDCKTDEEYLRKHEDIEKLAPLVKGISKYADKSEYPGNEGLAEAFVRMRNGEKVSSAVRDIVDMYVGGYKK